MKIRLRTQPDGTVLVTNEHGEPLEGVTHVSLSASAGQPPVTKVTFATEAVDVEAVLERGDMSFIRIRLPEAKG